jgi:hypothetical protein
MCNTDEMLALNLQGINKYKHEIIYASILGIKDRKLILSATSKGF